MATLSSTPARTKIAATTPVKTPGRAAQWNSRWSSTWNSTLGLGLLGGLLLWLALPPVNAWPLAWIAPVPWLVLVMRPQLTGRRPYRKLWLASFVFWLAALHWLTLPHWATGFGLLALAFYLAFYLPAFVGLARVGVQGLKMSPLLVAPVVWTGLELLRGYLLSGFSMANLAHTQYQWIELIQISDLAGAYGVSFLLMFGAACIAKMLPVDGRPRAWWPLAPLAVALCAALAYGYQQTHGDFTSPGPKVALIQGSIDTEMKADPNGGRAIWDEYVGLSEKAVRQDTAVELVVWPETMFRYPWFTFDADFRSSDPRMPPPAELTHNSRTQVAGLAERLQRPLLIGIDSVHYATDKMVHYNSALFTDRAGEPRGRYDKNHLVMFGEYVPFAKTFPWLYNLTPLPGGAEFGTGPVSVAVGSARFAPNICYESIVPHLIAGQVRTLRAAGQEPDVLVNLTNDGWFWGSAELDMHLACGVFRAIECRKPFLVAANTGFSASIDSSGRILAQGKRRATDIIIAEPRLDRRQSWYLLVGDAPAAVCLAGCGVLAVVGFRQRKKAPASAA